jgi:hypothetical protein
VILAHCCTNKEQTRSARAMLFGMWERAPHTQTAVDNFIKRKVKGREPSNLNLGKSSNCKVTPNERHDLSGRIVAVPLQFFFPTRKRTAKENKGSNLS